jgi:hypothetical protein
VYSNNNDDDDISGDVGGCLQKFSLVLAMLSNAQVKIIQRQKLLLTF